MTRVVGDLVNALQALLPPWAMALVLGFVALLFLPLWLRSVRIKQIRGLIRRMVRADDALRETLSGQVAELAGNSGVLWVTVATEARKRSQHSLYRIAVARLEGLGGHASELDAFARETAREIKRGGHPLEELVIIERLIDEGMDSTARERLDEALGRFPDDPDLRAAKATLDGRVETASG